MSVTVVLAFIGVLGVLITTQGILYCCVTEGGKGPVVDLAPGLPSDIGSASKGANR